MRSHNNYCPPVFLVFFNRPECLRLVFETVKQARPSILFLCQDGARVNNPQDRVNIERCREIVSHIDWDCELTLDYACENLGTGMRIYSGITNAFRKVESLIILEDDTVPCQSFFRFCHDLLEKYLHDQRVKIICGMNNLGTYDGTDEDYFFTDSGSCWGWATWRRAWENVEYDMPYLDNPKLMHVFEHYFHNRKDGRDLSRIGYARKKILNNGGKLSAWTYQHGMSQYLQAQLNIVPRKNMIRNVGLNDEATHAVNSIHKVPGGLQSVFFMKTYELDFPLKHPHYIINDKIYEYEVKKVMGWTLWGGYLYRIESIVRQIIYAEKGDYIKLWRKFINKIGL